MNDQLSATDLLTHLIRTRPVSGDEGRAGDLLAHYFAQQGWTVRRMEVAPGRYNLAVFFGTPRIAFSTHYDVVPAPEQLFSPIVTGGRITGRGACDALGALVTMVQAARALRHEGRSDFGLLFVVGEEDDGIGAKHAGATLADAGIRYLVNGEPTNGILASGQKGVLELVVRCTGRACHSGYPQLGEDANRKLFDILARIYQADFGVSDLFGPATTNVGVIRAGKAANIVSPDAEARILIRTVGVCAAAEGIVKRCIGDEGEFEICYRADPLNLFLIPGLPHQPVAFGSDIPNFGSMAPHYLMCGPGNIDRAHTDTEYIDHDEIEGGIQRYREIFYSLRRMG